jgi:hypothetical protein
VLAPQYHVSKTKIWDVLETTLCDKVLSVVGAGLWLSLGTLFFSNNKADHHNIMQLSLIVMNDAW